MRSEERQRAEAGAGQGPAAVTSAAEARAYARSVVREKWDSPLRTAREEDVVDLLLVVSELVTNAIRHGQGLAGFDAAVDGDGVRVVVRDRSDVVPRGALGSGELPRGHHGSGYGWPLIVRLAREIAVDRLDGGGKSVSVLVPLRESGRPDTA
ncbi:ATP-binding protein [Streptomyces naganishii]|uniref:ATP-binding protein n=1 Tax=Streptomyces naganishii TaxID=285447 RepID=UPI00167CD89B|nr:ATP-binding protein [Streptomyces naganishii]